MTLSEVSYNYGTTEDKILRLVNEGMLSYDEEEDSFDYDELVEKDEEIEEAIFGIIVEEHYHNPSYVGTALFVGWQTNYKQKTHI